MWLSGVEHAVLYAIMASLGMITIFFSEIKFNFIPHRKNAAYITKTIHFFCIELIAVCYGNHVKYKFGMSDI